MPLSAAVKQGWHPPATDPRQLDGNSPRSMAIPLLIQPPHPGRRPEAENRPSNNAILGD